MINEKKLVKQPPLIQYLPIVFLAFIIIFFGYRKFRIFEDVVDTKRGEMVLSKDRKAELREKQRQLEEDYVCYKLVANADGVYPCTDCPQGFFFLHKGEVAKYGITLHPNSRYPQYKLIEQNLSLVRIEKGSLTRMRQLELELIYHYPIIEENLNRPSLKDYLKSPTEFPRYKLARPPMNPIDK